MIGLLAATAAGRRAAADLAGRLPDARQYEGPVGVELPRAFAECDRLVVFLAVGATVRLLAPLLRDKAGDPGVVCVDEAGRFAVPVLGGHAGGANELADRIGELLGAVPVSTTATDAAGIPGLDTLDPLGWTAEGEVAAVTRAVLDGDPVRLVADRRYPLPALPANVREDAAPGAPVLRVSDRTAAVESAGAPVLTLRPRDLVVGVGASRGASAEEITALVDSVLAEAGLSRRSVTALATVDAKAEEPGILAAAEALGVRLVTHPAEALASIEVPNPSDAPLAAVGTPSVAEAAALATAPGGELLVPKRKSAPAEAGAAPMATAAVARRPVRGRLALVGLGPGARDLLTERARNELRRASVVVGLDQYLDQIRDLLRPGTRIESTGLGAEEARARSAVRLAQQGHAVALIGSGDAGVYAMASPALAEAGDDIDVVGVPGVTAALAAGSLLGAPLGHDHVSISLSDLHTPWEVIERRVRAAAEADLVVTFYNPRSRGRDWQLPKALAILSEHREPAATPVGVAHSVSRPDEWHTVTTLAEVDVRTVDMTTVVVVGNTASRRIAGRFVTPRGYRWQS
ncbi:precorrin-3B C(17)-methyltransferase [Phaeacidiphilus oryzae]|uniref:precorrin-3B C(17)-methyltransferase n=1 Tax=Phaeacidiphilus oryzae TaxID=348818 RepID=UPI00055EA0AB|nr:precorrin-3B C(17)-methyltransferase [Phaeacidiphilus oryzae]